MRGSGVCLDSNADTIRIRAVFKAHCNTLINVAPPGTPLGLVCTHNPSSPIKAGLLKSKGIIFWFLFPSPI